MRVREWLVNLGIVVLFDTLADLQGLWQEIRSEADTNIGKPGPAILVPVQPSQNKTRSQAA